MHRLGSTGGGEVTFSNLGSADDVAPVGQSAQHLEPTRGCFEAKAGHTQSLFLLDEDQGSKSGSGTSHAEHPSE